MSRRAREEFAQQTAAGSLSVPPSHMALPARPFAAVVYNRISHPSHPVGNAAFALFSVLPFCVLLSCFFSVLEIDNMRVAVGVLCFGFIENIKKSFIMGVRRARGRTRLSIATVDRQARKMCRKSRGK